MATDVDGTLLSSDQQLLPRVQQAVQRSVELGVPVRQHTQTNGMFSSLQGAIRKDCPGVDAEVAQHCDECFGPIPIWQCQKLQLVTNAAAMSDARCALQVVVATGKARGPWAARILPLLGPAVPGVFMQVKPPSVAPKLSVTYDLPSQTVLGNAGGCHTMIGQ